jgi:hypothetical protein
MTEATATTAADRVATVANLVVRREAAIAAGGSGWEAEWVAGGGGRWGALAGESTAFKKGRCPRM